MPSIMGVKGRKVFKIYATRSRADTNASQGPSDTTGANPATSSNMSGPNPAASPASPVLTPNSAARMDNPISGNSNHQTQSTLVHHPIPMANPGGSIGSNTASLPASTAMAFGLNEMPMIPAPPGYLPGHQDWVKVYGKIQKCDYCNGRSKEGVIYMCQPCKIYICKPCAVAERHNRDPHDPHVLDAQAVSWDGWERGPNRPAQPARPRGRSSKVVDKGRTDPALAEADTATATASQARQPANAASDAIVGSCHPIVPTITPAADSSHKRTVSALGSVELPPSKQVKISQPEQVLPNRLPSINALLQSLPEEFRTCPQNPADYFSSKEHLATKKYFSCYYLPLYKSLAGFSTGNQGHNHGRLPKDYFSARLPLPPSSIHIPQESSTTSSHRENLGTGFSLKSRIFDQENCAYSSSSLHRNSNNQLGAGPSSSRQDLSEFRSDPRPTGFSSASQAHNQEISASSSSSLYRSNNNHIGTGSSSSHQHLGEFRRDQTGFSCAPQASNQENSASSSTLHKSLHNNQTATSPSTSRQDPDQFDRGRPFSSSASQALKQDHTALCSSPHQASIIGGQIHSSTLRRDQDEFDRGRTHSSQITHPPGQVRTGSSVSNHRDLGHSNVHTDTFASRDSDQYQSNHRDLTYTTATQARPLVQYTDNNHLVDPSNRPYQEYNSVDRHHPSTSGQGLDHHNQRGHLGSSSTTSHHRTRPFNQRQDVITFRSRRNSEEGQRYSPIRYTGHQEHQSLGQDRSSAPSYHRSGHNHHGSFSQVDTAIGPFSSQRSPGLDRRHSHHPRLGQDYSNRPYSPGQYQPERRADQQHQNHTRPSSSNYPGNEPLTLSNHGGTEVPSREGC